MHRAASAPLLAREPAYFCNAVVPEIAIEIEAFLLVELHAFLLEKMALQPGSYVGIPGSAKLPA